MHGCSGINDHHRGWAGRLTEWGYAAALLDSFRPRNTNSTCHSKLSNPGPSLRAQDAFNAAIYLRTLPVIQPDHIGVIGFSHGGSAALFATLASERADRSRRASLSGGGRLLSADAFARCAAMPERILGEPASDLLILIGKDDTWTPAPDCLKYVELQSGFPHAPTIKVYPGALHTFDAAYRAWIWIRTATCKARHPEARADST